MVRVVRSVGPQLLARRLLHAVRGHAVRTAERFTVDGAPFREAWCRGCLGRFALDVDGNRLFPWNALFEGHRDRARAEQQRHRAGQIPLVNIRFPDPAGQAAQEFREAIQQGTLQAVDRATQSGGTR